ncbi:HAD-like domain-containing protein [Thelonectria olida]|uniref:HAD-like domain-containing protein n=1 Tax=Thelonectria olida TaxID=1576542 RepID=A0A9P8W2H1_9HYPO|nr:HAD-like domain-containing protein [Thelonectria olida]
MACCYIAAFCVGQLVKASQFLDLDEGIRYNDGEGFDPTDTKDPVAQNHKFHSDALILSLNGLTCSACTSAVEKAVSSLKGVDKVRVSLALQQATVISDGDILDQQLVLTTIRDLGYDAEPGPRTPKQVVDLLRAKEHISHLSSTFSKLARGVAVLQVLTWLASTLKGSSLTSWSLLWLFHVASMAVTFYIQYFHVAWIHANGWKWLKAGSINMNTLISLSMGLGSLLSFTDLVFRGPADSSAYYSTTVGLALVVVAGRYLDALSRRSGSKYLINLYKPMLKTHNFLRPSDEIIIEPFSEIPCDCYVSEGSSFVNQSIVTGESLPVKKTVGGCLLGGTRNQNHRLICVVQKETAESFYTRLVQLSTESTSTDSGGYNFIELAMRYFVTFVIVFSFTVPILTTFRVWHDSPPYEVFRHCVSRATTILTSACPCALGLAMPSAVVALVSSAGRKGILITGGIQTIQKLQNSRSVVFDKTGTLTEATLAVENVVVAPQWIECKDILWQYVCALEEHVTASHPIARAIFSSGLRELGPLWASKQPYRRCKSLTRDTGQGISAQVRLENDTWRHVKVGSGRYFGQLGIDGMPEQVRCPINGMISVHIAIDGKYAGTLYLGDTVRGEAISVIQDLKSMGYECGMLTGDTTESALRVSKMLRIPVLGSEATPTDKQDCIKSLQTRGKIVAMVGDGLNDAPSLSTADVGVALHRDSAYATMGASIMILNSRLESIALMYQMAQLTMRQIHFNLLWIFAYNIVGLSLASGMVTPFGFELNPPIAAMMMSMSSVCITLQSFRLQRRLEALSCWR